MRPLGIVILGLMPPFHVTALPHYGDHAHSLTDSPPYSTPAAELVKRRNTIEPPPITIDPESILTWLWPWSGHPTDRTTGIPLPTETHKPHTQSKSTEWSTQQPTEQPTKQSTKHSTKQPTVQPTTQPPVETQTAAPPPVSTPPPPPPSPSPSPSPTPTPSPPPAPVQSCYGTDHFLWVSYTVNIGVPYDSAVCDPTYHDLESETWSVTNWHCVERDGNTLLWFSTTPNWAYRINKVLESHFPSVAGGFNCPDS